MTPVEFWIGILASIVTGALVNEFCDVSPWLAHRLVRRAAHRWQQHDAELAAVYEEEWAALVDDCPGKLSKLALALRFASSAAARAQIRRGREVVVRLRRRGRGSALLFSLGKNLLGPGRAGTSSARTGWATVRREPRGAAMWPPTSGARA